MTDNTFTRVDLDSFGTCAHWPEYKLLAALRAAYAEIDRLQSQLIAVQEDAMTIYGDNDRLTAEIDRLRANALEWVTVTDDINTLPYKQGLVVVVPADGRPTFITTRNRNIFPGDRWAYIPEVPHADN